MLDRAEIDRHVELYRSDSAQRRSSTGLPPNRAEVVLAGACIVRSVLAKLGRDSFTVSDRGLRHGLLVERFAYRGGREKGMRAPLWDTRVRPCRARDGAEQLGHDG